MKYFILALMLSVALAVPTDKDEEAWEAFKTKHGKSYSSKTTEAKRKNTFLKNKAKIDKINNSGGTHQAKLYPFHDLEDYEFYEQYANLKSPKINDIKPRDEGVQINEINLPESLATAPASYDARNFWKFAPIRNQAQCGSCWAFSTINSLEVAIWKKYYNNYGDYVWDLSEQELVDCAKRDAYWGNNGCEGWFFDRSIDYLGKVWGVTLERDYPYTAKFGACRTDKTKYFGAPKWIKIANDATSIKNAIMQYGSLGVYVLVDDGWASYSGGVYSNPAVTSFNRDMNHAVNLIGWGYDTTYKMEYWIIRNSWDTWWGDKGYIRVATAPSGQMKPDWVYAAYFP